MDFARQQRDPARRAIGIVAVVALHALVVYALATSLSRKTVNVIDEPITVAIIANAAPPAPAPEPVLVSAPMPRFSPPAAPLVPFAQPSPGPVLAPPAASPSPTPAPAPASPAPSTKAPAQPPRIASPAPTRPPFVAPQAPARMPAPRVPLITPMVPTPPGVPVIPAPSAAQSGSPTGEHQPVAPPPPARQPAVREGVAPIHKEALTYPRSAIRAGIDRGRVLARLDIDENGDVTAVHIVSADPSRYFDAAVREGLMRWKFAADGTRYSGTIEVRFALRD